MTEEEWLACAEPDSLFEVMEHKASNRKLRLFTFACCHRIWDLFESPICRRVVELLEQVADNHASESELELAAIEARAFVELPEARLTETSCSAAYTAAYATEHFEGERLIWVAFTAAGSVRDTQYWAAIEAIDAPGAAIGSVAESYGRAARQAEGGLQAVLFREIFGNPFRPVAFNPAWRTSDVMLLAKGIYDERAFDRMPILADALEDAGCTSDDILNHLRDPHATHVRGCWALDLVLGKE